MPTRLTPAGERLVRKAAAMYADAGNFTDVGVDAIVAEAGTSKRVHSDAGGKDGVITRVVTAAADGVWAELDRLWPERQGLWRGHGWTLPQAVRQTFADLSGGLRDEQTLLVMAAVELPRARPPRWSYESKGRAAHPARAVLEAHDRRVFERLAMVLGWSRETPEAEAGGRALTALLAAAHLSVARGRQHELAALSDLAIDSLTD